MSVLPEPHELPATDGATRIYLIEDDPSIARTVVYAMERAGLRVTHCLLVADAVRQIDGAAYDALVLDIGLPDGSGLDLLRQLRSQFTNGGHVFNFVRLASQCHSQTANGRGRTRGTSGEPCASGQPGNKLHVS